MALSIIEVDVDYVSQGQIASAVRGVSLTVPVGGAVALVGESGSGKSTLARAVMGHLSLTSEVDIRGSVHVGGVTLPAGAAPPPKVAMIYQQSQNALNPMRRIGDQVAEGVPPGEVDRRGRWRRVVEALAAAGLDERYARAYPHELSGGMRQRAVIAMALASRPDVLIADETTTALDVTTQAQILQTLERLREEHGMAVLYITHDLGVVAGYASFVHVMKDGRIVESGPVAEIFRRPRDAYTAQLIGSVTALSSGRPAMFNRSVASDDSPDTPVLSVDGIRFRYGSHRGRRQASGYGGLRGVNLSLRRGEVLGLVGESGSGKSTTARVILGLLAAQEGSVAWSGQPLSSVSRRELRAARAQVQLIQQDPYGSLNPYMTIEEIIAEPLCNFRSELSATQRRELVLELMSSVNLSADLLARRPRQISGGQCQRVSIARALAANPRVLVCDEPTSALDVTVRRGILELLGGLAKDRHLAVLLITHDLMAARYVAHRVAVMYNGLLVEEGDADDVLRHPFHPYTRRLVMSCPEPDPEVVPPRVEVVEVQHRAGDQACVFAAKCTEARDQCLSVQPQLDVVGPRHSAACHFPHSETMWPA